MKQIVKLLQSTFIRYGIMAVIVVCIELTSFWIFDSLLNWHYLLATWLSLFIGIVLNWAGSHYFVFGNSLYTKKREFALVVFTSMAGVLLQSGVVAVVVEALSGPAMTGKVFAIIITFFWNYFVRKRYIYANTY